MEHLYFDLIGYFSIFLAILSFIAKDTFKMRFHGMTSTLTFAISIIPYGGLNGFFVSILSATSKLLSLKYPEEKLFFLKILSPFLAVIFFLFFNKEGFFGILPAVSLIFVIFADLQKDILKMKQMYLFIAFIWIIYGLFLMAIPSIIYDIVAIIFLSISIFKITQEKKEKILYNKSNSK